MYVCFVMLRPTLTNYQQFCHNSAVIAYKCRQETVIAGHLMEIEDNIDVNQNVYR